MRISELEFERDPTLRYTRTYDKLNPEVEGFKEVIGRGAQFSGLAYWAPDASNEHQLALADLEDNTHD